MERPRPLALLILDGYGISTKNSGNAVTAAETPVIDALFADYPHTQLQASGEAVGLPAGQMGNSEVGHLNLGAGRIVYQDYTRINKSVASGELEKNKVILQAIEHIKKYDSSLHLVGLLSDGGVHSHIDHLFGLLDLAKKQGLTKVYIHVILDGRDTPPQSSRKYISQLEVKLEELGIGEISTVSGRYYSMDRDNRWERTEKAYRVMVTGEGEQVDDPIRAVDISYDKGNNDEFVLPTLINKDGLIKDNDSLIFFNFRSDRARQITRALALEDFSEFTRPAQHPVNLFYLCMTEYDEEFNLPVAFPTEEIANGLAEILSREGIKQLRIAETEKYAHVTFFFNGGIEEPYPGEERELIPSPKVATYDLKPAMSAVEVTEKLREKIKEDRYDVIILNYANLDMVGHTGDFQAAVQAVETVDDCLGKIVPLILEKGGQILLTADHGNSEKMKDEKGEPFTAHTSNPVPLIYIGGPTGSTVKPGKLADIAPTMLALLGLDKPADMTGQSLLEHTK